jgi:hypothetical protein
MKTKALALLCVCALTAGLSGCVTALDGRQHAGVPFIKDKFEGRYERTPMDCWTAAKDVLRFNGSLYSEDTLKSTLEASINERTVWVRVEPIDPKVTRVTVQARTRGGGSDLDLAREIEKQIALHLATGGLPTGTAATKSGN